MQKNLIRPFIQLHSGKIDPEIAFIADNVGQKNDVKILDVKLHIFMAEFLHDKLPHTCLNISALEIVISLSHAIHPEFLVDFKPAFQLQAVNEIFNLVKEILELKHSQ